MKKQINVSEKAICGNVFLSSDFVIKTKNFEITKHISMSSSGVDGNGYIYYELDEDYVTHIMFRGDTINDKALERMRDEGMETLTDEYDTICNGDTRDELIIKLLRDNEKRVSNILDVESFKIDVEDNLQYAIDSLSSLSSVPSAWFLGRLIKPLEGGEELLDKYNNGGELDDILDELIERKHK